MPIPLIIAAFGWLWRGARGLFNRNFAGGAHPARLSRWAAVQLGPRADEGAKLEAAHLERDLAGTVFAPVRLLVVVIIALSLWIGWIWVITLPGKAKKIASLQLTVAGDKIVADGLRADLTAALAGQAAALSRAKSAVAAIAQCESESNGRLLAAAEREKARDRVIRNLRIKGQRAINEAKKPAAAGSAPSFSGPDWLRGLSPDPAAAGDRAPDNPAPTDPPGGRVPANGARSPAD